MTVKAEKIAQIENFMSHLESYIKDQISAATAKYDSSVQYQRAGRSRKIMEETLHKLFNI